MLYFQGRDGTPVEEAHKSLQFKLKNIKPDDPDLNLAYVTMHEEGINKNPCGAYTNLKNWGLEFCRQAKAILKYQQALDE